MMGHRTDSDAVEIAELHAENERLRAALLDARKFVEGMNKPAAPGIMTISSYSPCHELLDKIAAALRTERQSGNKEG